MGNSMQMDRSYEKIKIQILKKIIYYFFQKASLSTGTVCFIKIFQLDNYFFGVWNLIKIKIKCDSFVERHKI